MHHLVARTVIFCVLSIYGSVFSMYSMKKNTQSYISSKRQVLLLRAHCSFKQ